MRLFIAIQLPKEVQEYLAEFQKNLPHAGKITFTKESHLTLRFLGEVLPEKEKEVEQQLQKVKFQKFIANLSEIGVFPDEKSPRVLWVGVEPEKQIKELREKIESSLERSFEPEKNFKPHLTICRIKELEDKKQFLDTIKKVKVKNLKFEIKEFALIKSDLSREGPKYAALQKYAAILY